MMKTSKECSYAIRTGVGAGVFVIEYPQEAYAEWLEVEFNAARQIAGEIEWTPPVWRNPRPTPVATHVLSLTPTQHYYGWGYALALCELLEGHNTPLTEAELDDLQFRLQVGLVEPISDGGSKPLLT